MSLSPSDFEKLGVFYLGRPIDPEQKGPAAEGPLLYPSKDLVTHAVCVGMTGSGKTGLGLALLEEAGLDGVPAIAIDPKGDLPNLLLGFPQLRGEDFAPWVDSEEAARAGLSPEAFAAQQAETWKAGLAQWGEDGARIQKLRDTVELAVYTPGARAGLPVSILRSFAPPKGAAMEDPELARQRVGTLAGSLIALAGIEAPDPIHSREHILISTLLSSAWEKGEAIDLPKLIHQVQSPPLTRIGVLDLESFYPAKERFNLVLALNNLIAAPGFASWTEGAPLDVASLLHTPGGRPRISIFSIAHLGDTERMFFVSLLLNEMVGWMRSQTGTSSLRAVLYIDEMFGFLPPVAQPPSKLPLLTLLKQGRAAGLGVVLSTQNPADLDYKALSNAGTWFIGRLQTERDRARVVQGLQGAFDGSGKPFDRERIDALVAGLGKRQFLMHNAHEDHPEVFESRWTLSYLRGPLTREQIKTLGQSRASAAGAVPSSPPPLPEEEKTHPSHPAARPASAPSEKLGTRPALPPQVPQFFAPMSAPQTTAGPLCYRPRLLGAVRLLFTDGKLKLSLTQERVFLTPVTDDAVPVDWAHSEPASLTLTELRKTGVEDALFEEPPGLVADPKRYETWTKAFSAWLVGSQGLTLLRSPSLGLVSNPGETERDFRARLQLAQRERRDEATEGLKAKYAPKLAALEERARRADQAVEREKAQAGQQKLQTAISVGATVLGAMFGRKLASAANLGRASTAARGVGLSMQQEQDVARAAETAGAVRQQLADLQAEFQAEVDAAAKRIDPGTESLETVTLRVAKSRVEIQLVALVWLPG